MRVRSLKRQRITTSQDEMKVAFSYLVDHSQETIGISYSTPTIKKDGTAHGFQSTAFSSQELKLRNSGAERGF